VGRRKISDLSSLLVSSLAWCFFKSVLCRNVDWNDLIGHNLRLIFEKLDTYVIALAKNLSNHRQLFALLFKVWCSNFFLRYRIVVFALVVDTLYDFEWCFVGPVLLLQKGTLMLDF